MQFALRSWFGGSAGARSDVRRASVFAALLVAAGAWTGAIAQPVSIGAAPTTLASTSDRMISYRHQEHMWQTSDGATHVMINTGGDSSGQNGLVMYSSFDGGQSWTQMFALVHTNANSTGDGSVTNDLLSLTYASDKGTILYTTIQYNATLRTWTTTKVENVYSNSQLNSINPAIATDAMGRVWCAYITTNRSGTLRATIHMAERDSDQSGWQDTGLQFGTPDNGAQVQRSARPVVINGGMGMVYTVHQYFYWTARQDSAPITSAWPTQQTLFTSKPPYDNDPYASHFSVVGDTSGNVHLALTDHGELLYLRYVGAGKGWGAVKTLTSDIGANYVQTTLALGNLMLLVNDVDADNTLQVYQSSDKGTTFTNTQTLTHDPAPVGGTIDYTGARIETPGHALGPVPVLEQYIDTATAASQRMLYFAAPVVRVSTASAPKP